MIFNNKAMHQGDVQLYGLTSLPTGLTEIIPRFIAASERTDSFHALFGKYKMYERAEGGTVLVVEEECTLNHSLGSVLRAHGGALDTNVELQPKDHRKTIVAPGIYFAGIQQQFDPLEGFLKKVTD